MSELEPEALLGAIVVELACAAAERWAQGDDRGAEALAAGLLRLCDHQEFIDTDSESNR